MRLYADAGPVRSRQLIGDLLVLAWTLLWVRLAFEVHEQVGRLAAPGRALQQAGDGLSSNLDSAAEGAGRVPVLGGAVRAPLAGAAAGGRSLADAGRALESAVGALGTLLAIVVVVVTVGVVLGQWLPRRARWVGDATAARRLMAAPGGLEVLAVRAAAQQPLSRLAKVEPAVLRGWVRGEQEATARLAELSLQDLGLRPRR